MNTEDVTDHKALLLRALSEAAKPDEDGRSFMGEFVATAHAVQWLQVMAVPRLFESLKRKPDRAHLLTMVDIYIARVRSGKQIFERPDFQPVPYEQREPLAMKLRSLLETWNGGSVTEIATIVRELLYSDGLAAPEGGWDNVPDPDIPPEEYLLWPEDAGDFLVYSESADTLK